MEFTVKHDLWGNERDLLIPLPDRWDARVLHMEGDSKTALTEDDLQKVLGTPGPDVEGKERGMRAL